MNEPLNGWQCAGNIHICLKHNANNNLLGIFIVISNITLSYLLTCLLSVSNYDQNRLDTCLEIH